MIVIDVRCQLIDADGAQAFLFGYKIKILVVREVVFPKAAMVDIAIVTLHRCCAVLLVCLMIFAPFC